MLGDAAGMTAGSGMDGLGETERRMDCADTEPKDDRRLCEVAGGFIGKASDCGVPGADGAGEATAWPGISLMNEARPRKSGGAGLLAEILRCGRSILVTWL